MFKNKLDKNKENSFINSNYTKEQNGLKEKISSFILTLIMVIAIVAPIRFFIAKPFVVYGTSMDPTFHSWDYLIVDVATYKFFDEPKRGDVIIFSSPVSDKYYIKRIIGLPNETVEIINGKVVIKNKDNPYGFELKEPYISPKNRSYRNMTYDLGENEYFVMGDNRAGSYDSRFWGALKKGAIVGRAFIRLYPFNKIELFPGAYNNY